MGIRATRDGARRRAGVAAAVLAATGLVSAGAAVHAAATPIKPHSLGAIETIYTGTIHTETDAEQDITCPAGTSPISGGVLDMDRNEPWDGTTLYRSYPIRDQWRVEVANTRSSADFEAYATCASVDNYQVVMDDFSNPASSPDPGATGDSHVSCPAGTSLLGGGQWISGPDNVAIAYSKPSSGSWFVELKNNNSIGIGVQAEAVCGSGLAGYQIVEGDAQLAPGGNTEAGAYCPSGMTVIGGGGGNVDPYSSTAEASFPDGINPGGTTFNGWIVGARSVESFPVWIGAFAICAS